MSGRSVATRLNRNAIATPKPISVNMLRLRVLSDCHARSKKGQPPHRTTGVASASCAHCALAGSISRSKLIPGTMRSEEHTSELQSLMRISYAVFCLKKKQQKKTNTTHTQQQSDNMKKQQTQRDQKDQ